MRTECNLIQQCTEKIEINCKNRLGRDKMHFLLILMRHLDAIFRGKNGAMRCDFDFNAIAIPGFYSNIKRFMNGRLLLFAKRESQSSFVLQFQMQCFRTIERFIAVLQNSI